MGLGDEYHFGYFEFSLEFSQGFGEKVRHRGVSLSRETRVWGNVNLPRVGTTAIRGDGVYNGECAGAEKDQK